jgi:hypothetical protein
MTFFNFQIINKVFGFLSIVFSLITFISCIINYFDVYMSDKDNILITLIVSFFSILCVIIALYSSPNRRINDYIFAWRIEERTINEMIAEMDTYNTLSQDACKKKAREYMNRISSVEENIKSDED